MVTIFCIPRLWFWKIVWIVMKQWLLGVYKGDYCDMLGGKHDHLQEMIKATKGFFFYVFQNMTIFIINN